VSGARASRVRGIVFDLDGTLVDTMPVVVRGIAHAIAPFVDPPSPAEIYRRVAGPADRCLAELLGGDRHVAEAVERLFAYAREHGREIEVYPGAAELLAELQAANRPVALWTGRDRTSAMRILEEANLRGHFGAVVCGDDLPTHKPDPEGFRHLATSLEVPATELLMVGDAEVDVIGAARAGAQAILIHQEREISAAVRALRPDLVDTPAAAFRRIREWLA